MLNAFDLASRDSGSPSDPYLILQLNKKVFNESKNYILDEPNPVFNKLYEFEASFPGASPLSIKVMDFDDVFGDDIIGETLVDLEDRYFSAEWQSLKQKPIEFR
jgi:Ca2+-dependent lipid-binding protein